jgi:hypothetical protein
LDATAGVTKAMSQKRNMPSRKAISHYWQHEADWVEMMGYGGVDNGHYDDEFMPDECWACGLKYPNGFATSPDRCHVVSHWEGGNEECSNLVLMCRTCHQQSENIPSNTFWIWIKSMRKSKWRNQYEWMSEKLEMVGLGMNIIAQRFENGASREEVWSEVCMRLGLGSIPLPEPPKL